MARSRVEADTESMALVPTGTGEQLRRIANLLALLATKGESQRDKVLTLTAAGFSTSEVATLLRVKPNTVAVAVYQAKRDRTSKRGPRTDQKDSGN